MTPYIVLRNARKEASQVNDRLPPDIFGHMGPDNPTPQLFPGRGTSERRRPKPNTACCISDDRGEIPNGRHEFAS